MCHFITWSPLAFGIWVLAKGWYFSPILLQKGTNMQLNYLKFNSSQQVPCIFKSFLSSQRAVFFAPKGVDDLWLAAGLPISRDLIYGSSWLHWWKSDSHASGSFDSDDPSWAQSRWEARCGWFYLDVRRLSREKLYFFMQSSTQKTDSEYNWNPAFQFQSHLGIGIMFLFQVLYGSSRIDLQQV